MRRQVEKFDNVDTTPGMEAMNLWLAKKEVTSINFTIINTSFVSFDDGITKVLYAFITYSE